MMLKSRFIFFAARVLIAGLLIGGLFSSIFLNMRYHRAVQQTTMLRDKLQLIRRQNEELKMTISRTYHLIDLEKEAKQRLGMMAPVKVEFIYINE